MEASHEAVPAHRKELLSRKSQIVALMLAGILVGAGVGYAVRSITANNEQSKMAAESLQQIMDIRNDGRERLRSMASVIEQLSHALIRAAESTEASAQSSESIAAALGNEPTNAARRARDAAREARQSADKARASEAIAKSSEQAVERIMGGQHQPRQASVPDWLDGP